ncbi:Uncharacterised protein [Burkholderia pseudomallei]|nr:Uncharacterised protein [Burkholderia pseudomallei]CAJ4201779.1 Uncharacterised protein [Burkholderia pseudomallei]CAJ4665437.1 Uncharacterised protein [Burkholderia pseudomallei]CAJ6390242.1 Uncharacterised protein [Burkholderia pseudomallei]CAJ8801735.1 Uncharacterised protein [Burkholderia pseudomallei]
MRRLLCFVGFHGWVIWSDKPYGKFRTCCHCQKTQIRGVGMNGIAPWHTVKMEKANHEDHR